MFDQTISLRAYQHFAKIDKIHLVVFGNFQEQNTKKPDYLSFEMTDQDKVPSCISTCGVLPLSEVRKKSFQ